MARGNASLSALMRGASAARDKQLAYNDQAADYSWNVSAKTQDDFNQYQSYLKKRQGTTVDPSKQLTLQGKQDTAFRGFTSSEVARQTMAVEYGDQSNMDKYRTIQRLQQQAIGAGDYNLAQSLESRMASLSITIQNEQTAAANKADAAGKKAYNQGFTDQNHTIDAIKNALDQSMKTGQAPQNPDGSPVRWKVDANGKVILDANGNVQPDAKAPPLNLTSNNYSIINGALLEQKASLLQSYIDSGADTSGAKQAQLDTLKASNDYLTHTNPSVQQALQRGEDPLTYKVDDNGLVTATPKTVTGRQAVIDPKTGQPAKDPQTGQLLYTNTYETGAKPNTTTGKLAGNNYDYYRKLGTSPNSAVDDFTQKVMAGGKGEQRIDPITGKPALVEGQDYVVDPVTGKTIYLSSTTDPLTGKTTVQRSLSPLDSSGNASTKNDFLSSTPEKGALAKSGDFLTAGLKPIASVASRVPGMIGSFGNTLTGILNSGQAKQQQVAAQQKAAADLAASQALAKQRSDAAIASLNALPRANPAVAPTVSGNKVVGGVGAPAVPAAYVQAQNTAATPQFTQTYLPVAAGIAPGGGKPWWQL